MSQSAGGLEIFHMNKTPKLQFERIFLKHLSLYNIPEQRITKVQSVLSFLLPGHVVFVIQYKVSDSSSSDVEKPTTDQPGEW